MAFYVQQPLGLFIGNVSVLPRGTLVAIVIAYKPQLEAAIGANISDVEAILKPTTSTVLPTAGTVEPSSNDWKWIVIGVSVGVVVIIVAVIVIVVWW